MKNSKKFISSLAKSAAERALKRSANSTTCGAFYQPEVPAKLDSFKKAKR